MATIKLHEATKQFEIANKLAMFFLEKVNLPVKSHSSVIPVDQLELLREFAASPEKITTLETAAKKGAAAKAKAAAPPPAAPHGDAAAKPPAAPAKKKAAAEKKPAPVSPRAAEKKAPEKKPAEKKTVVSEPVAKPVKAATPPPAVPHGDAAAKPTAAPHRDAAAKPTAAPAKAPDVKKAVRPEPEAQRPPRPAPAPFIPAPSPFRRQQPQYHPRRHEPAAPKFHPPKKEKPAVAVVLPSHIQITDFCTMKELAEKLNLKLKPLEDKIAQLKMNYQGNQIIDRADIEKICADLGVALEILPYEDYLFQSYLAKSGSQLIPRPPIVTVMGHVDHGKTTLLDTLRKTRVAEKEAGGITQKIGAYKLQTADGAIVFIDTPGHEAFTNLRARGAQVTDIVILVVAANDGVQPQTVEAINHAQAAKVPMIVAINKIDIQGADSEKIKQELNKHNILVESWGGKVVSVEISAKFNKNLDTLLEMIQLVAQMQELKAYIQIPARGTIIESRLDPQLGPIGTVLIQHGQLKKGDYFICGSDLGKIKSIFDDSGKMLNSAQVPDPIEIMGFEALPQAGDVFQVIDDLEKARKVIEMRQISLKAAKSKDFLAEKRLSLQNLFQLVEQNVVQVFPVIVKADNFGSAEVLGLTLNRLSQEKLKIEILHSGLGNITESDILLASTARAVILGFNVKTPQKILSLAQQEKVEIRLYNVIYHLVEDIEKAVKGKIGPQYQQTLIGKVEILQKFKISNVGIVAGCVVRDGKVTRKSKIKVMRGDDLVFEGEIESLKRIKDEVSEVRAGTECGIRIKNFNTIEVGDLLDVYETTILP
ncbi:MAG: translation initiation factor IF-2 [Candidatus Aminicenantes bacterium]|nr:translation initiation factor IF-2 [Candidatus Aminicenantes bacterium]